MTVQPKETINLLPKIHKLKNFQGSNLEQNQKGRPMVNDFQFTTSKISRILNEYMLNIHDNLKILLEQKEISFPCIANSDRLISELKNTYFWLYRSYQYFVHYFLFWIHSLISIGNPIVKNTWSHAGCILEMWVSIPGDVVFISKCRLRMMDP